MKRNAVLVVDDDQTIREMIRLALEEVELECELAEDGRSALAALDSGTPAVVVLDMRLPDIHGSELLEQIRERNEDIPVVVITGENDVQLAVDCMRAGAADFVQKPFEMARLAATVRSAHRQGVMAHRLTAVSRERRDERGLATIRGESASLGAAIKLLRKAIDSEITILIEGESGTGKEVLARAIHFESSRGSAPFVPVNCGAIPEALIESELFGHEKGAFTGAQGTRAGLFEQAEGGTIFLDEIGELQPDLQVRLLRVLQERTVKRVGGNREIDVDVRVIAATNRNLQSEVAESRFREDLYYRLSVFPVNLPPLREREGDIMILAQHFLQLHRERGTTEVGGFTKEAEAALGGYPWPGNVRQLQNVIERAMILAEGPEVELEDLADDVVCHYCEEGDPVVRTRRSLGGRVIPGPGGRPERDSLGQDGAPRPADCAEGPAPERVRSLADVEKSAILHALGATDWNVKETARQLGIGRATLYRRLHQYGIERDGGAEAPESGSSGGVAPRSERSDVG